MEITAQKICKRSLLWGKSSSEGLKLEPMVTRSRRTCTIRVLAVMVTSGATYSLFLSCGDQKAAVIRVSGTEKQKQKNPNCSSLRRAKEALHPEDKQPVPLPTT